jgi:hypothetical protein
VSRYKCNADYKKLTNKKPSFREGLFDLGGEVFSHALANALSSPLRFFTTEFGMGSGRTNALKPPCFKVYNSFC